jgi:uncharacterized protein YndB with AHSA1/START domain
LHMAEVPDRIEKQVVLKAPRSRVWRALSHAPEFGRWFGAKLEGATFAVGKRTSGQVTEPGYEHLLFEVEVDRMEPERLLAWRWHPGADAVPFDSPDHPTTEVVFELSDAPGGTLLKVTETGFSRLPLAVRAKAHEENTGGWDGQLENIRKHLGDAA